MNIKIMAGGIIIIFVLLIVTFSWNSDAQKPAHIGELTSLKISQGNMTGMQEVTLDVHGTIVATLTTYGDIQRQQIRGGVLSSDDRVTIVRSLEKYNLASLKSEIPPPDATTSHLVVVEGGNTHDLTCVMGSSKCAKLVDELLAEFAAILSRQ